MGFMIASAIIGVIGTAISTYAAFRQAATQEEAAKVEADFRIQEAESARQNAAYQEKQYRRRVALLLGKQAAIIGATGVDPTVGSPLLMELDSIKQGELEALNIRRTGAVSAFGQEYEARLARQRAAFAGTRKGFAIASGVVGTSTSILGSWSNMNTSKTPATWGGYL